MVRRELPVEVVGAASEVALAPQIAEDAPTKPEGLPVALLREKPPGVAARPTDAEIQLRDGLERTAQRRAVRHQKAEAVARVVSQSPVEVAPIPLVQTKVRPMTAATAQLKKPSAASIFARDCFAAVLGFAFTGLVFAAAWFAIQWT